MQIPSPLSYTDIGKGPAVVLIHGLCESKEVWKEFSEALTSNYRIISIDIPGFGKSVLNQEHTSMEYYAGRIYEELEKLRLDKFVIAGHSLGGYIALAFEEIYGHCLNGLVLFHSTAFPDTEEKKADRNKTIEFVEKNGAQAFSKVLIPTLFTPENFKIFKSKADELIETAGKSPVHGITSALKAMRDRKDRRDVLTNTKNPVLFIVGKNDKVVPVEASLKQCSLPQESVTYFIEGAAHMGMVEKFRETLGIFKDFIDLCQSKL